MDSITFEVETSRILKILSSEIYDSPQAFLRENVQNAYDGILMRCAAQGRDIAEFTISITLTEKTLVVEDQGIGMSEETLRQNYWKAGSSGKRNELAQRAGVIGSFGIGAMANFGVCEELQVETRHIDSEISLVSLAKRSELQISRDCISLEKVIDNREPGTKITAQLDPEFQVTEQSVRAYLNQYVRFLPLPVLVNGQLISQQVFENDLKNRAVGFNEVTHERVSNDNLSFDLGVSLNSQGTVLVRATKLVRTNQPISGEAFLFQNGGQTLGFRNLFGLAPIPVSSTYSFGGFVNLSTLHPTAGREALSRDSVQFVADMVSLIEKSVSECVSKTDFADRNVHFQQYIQSHQRIDLAGKLRVQVLPENEDLNLCDLKNYQSGKAMRSYQGRDAMIIKTFANEQSNLVNISQSNPRRWLQLNYLAKFTDIVEVPDQISVQKIPPNQLNFEEAMFTLKVRGILMDDYHLSDVDLSLANISHGVMVQVTQGAPSSALQICISREAPAVMMVVECYRTARDVFSGFVKDYVREHIYPQIRRHIPSATRQGRDALLKRLKANRELFSYEEEDFGQVESLLSEYLSGRAAFGDVIRAASSVRDATQKQQIVQGQVGSVETVIPDIALHNAGGTHNTTFDAAPPILRTDLATEMKVLTVSSDFDKLNGIRLFVSLSERATHMEGEFLKWPHSTRVIWGSHKIIYIFTDQNDTTSLYYEIELKEPLISENTGGVLVPTTTVVTRHRTFIPVPREIESAFLVLEGTKEFYVRFDTLLKS